ncbi:MAG TPA: energy-coupling factor transporter transmembrane component T [Protaetiibacter sp.]|nr:energy-coupling factor transporter transmembrane component T [Protaetiibacter sp.]
MKIEYQPGTSLLHRLDVRVKLFGFLVLLVLSFLWGRWEYNLALSVVAVALILWAGARPRQLLTLLGPLSVIVVIVMVFGAYSYSPASAVLAESREVVVSFPDGALPLTVGGISYGVSLGLRIITMVIATSLLLLCTPIDHFVAAMRQGRVPHVIVFIVMTALRFIPTLQHRAEQVLDAQRARGATVDQGGMIRRVRAYIPVMVPLLTSGIRMSDDLAAAMINRGWGATPRPTALFTLHAAARDAVALVVLLLVLAAGVTVRVFGWGIL